MIGRNRRENRFLEFKSNCPDARHLGEYISALSNGACLDRQDYGFLFFGVDDDTLTVKRTTFDVTKLKAKGNQALSLYLKLYVDPKIDFRFEEKRRNFAGNLHELYIASRYVQLFQGHIRTRESNDVSKRSVFVPVV